MPLGPDTLWLASLRRGASETGEMLHSLARLYTAGLRVDWQGFDGGFPRRKVTVPSYPFQRESYWLPSCALVGTAVKRGETGSIRTSGGR